MIQVRFARIKCVQIVDGHIEKAQALEIDIGFTANGGGAATLTVSDTTTYTNFNSGVASANGIIDSGVLNGDTITDLLGANLNFRPVQGVKTGPMTVPLPPEVIWLPDPVR